MIHLLVIIVRLILLRLCNLILLLYVRSDVVRNHRQEIRFLFVLFFYPFLTFRFIALLSCNIFNFGINFISFLQKESEELPHGEAALVIKRTLVILAIKVASVQNKNLVVGDFFFFNIKHGNELFDIGLWVEVCKKHDNLAQGDFVILENIFGYLISLLDYEVVKPFLFLQTDILVFTQTCRSSFKIIFKKKIANLEPSTI